MNESLDLRNRILKMRESNNLLVTNPSSLNNNLMSKFESSIKDDNSKKLEPEKTTVNNKIKDITTKSLKSNTEKEIFNKDISQNKNHVSSKNDNEAQFLMLANKFNEAVEVILELSEKVENLEKLSRKKPYKTKDKNFFLMFFNLKIFAFLVIIPLMILGFFTLPFDVTIIKSIITDIVSII